MIIGSLAMASRGPTDISENARLEAVAANINAPYMRTQPDGQQGLQKFSRDRMQSAEEMLKKNLGPGEEILREFDCFFPEKKRKMWRIILLTVLTLGLYLVYLGILVLIKLFQKFTMRHRCILCCCPCCAPNTVHESRGKLAITTKGRVISWIQTYDQTLLGKVRPYVIINDIKIFKTSDVREMSVEFYSPDTFGLLLCCFPCCLCIVECCGAAEFGELVSSYYSIQFISTLYFTVY